MDVFSLAAKLTLDSSGFNSGVASAESKGNKLSTSLNKIVSVAKKLAGAAVIGKVAKSLKGLADETAAAGDRIDKTSQKLGLSRQAFQEWDYILSQNGASVDSLGVAMKTLTNKIGSGSDAITALGLDLKEVQSMSTEDAFSEIVTAFQKLPDGATKSALAIEMFGKQGQELMPLLNGTAEGTEALRKKFHDLGLEMTDEQVDAAVNYTDAMDTLTRTFDAIKQTIGAALLPKLTEWATALANVAGKLLRAYKDDGLLGVFTELDTMLGNLTTYLRDTGNPVFQLFADIIDGIRGAIKLAVGLMSDFEGTVQNLKASDSVPLVLLGSALELIKGILDWVREHKDVVVTAVTAIIGAFAVAKIVSFVAALGPMKILLAAIAAVAGLIIDNWEPISAFFEELWAAVSGAAQAAWDTVSKWLADAGTAISSAWSTVQSFFEGLWNAVSQAATNAWNSVSQWFASAGEKISTAWATVQSFFESLWKAVGQAATDAWNSISQWFGEVGEGISTAWATVQSFFEELWKAVGTAAQNAWNSISQWFGEAGEGISSAWATVQGFFEGLWQAVGSAAQNAWTSVTQWFGNVGESISGAWGTVQKFFEDMWSAISGAFSAAWTAIQEFWADPIGSITKAWGTIAGWLKTEVWDKVAQFFTDAWEKVKEFWKDPLGSIKQAWNQVAGWLKTEVWDKIKSYFTTMWNNVKKFWADPLGTISSAWSGVAGWISEHVTGPVIGFFQSVVSTIQGAIDKLRSFIGLNSSNKTGMTAGRPDIDETALRQTLDTMTPSQAESFLAQNGYTYDSATDTFGFAHAKGAWNIPYDDYFARLHRGEMVLTASQARQYREGAGGFDMAALSGAIVAAVKQGLQDATVRSFLDGRELTDAIGRIMGEDLTARRFA